MKETFRLGICLVMLCASVEAREDSSRFAKLDGLRVHYTAQGHKNGAALVFVHGWNCDETIWKNQVDALGERVRVITIDLPGHGQSDKPEQWQYTMDLHARALDAVMQKEELRSAVLVGHSNGTPVIRQFYRHYPEKTRALVIVDGALRPFGDANFMEKFIAPLRGRDYLQTAGRFINGMTAPIKEEAQREEVRVMMRRGPQYVAVSEMESLQDEALWVEDKIEVPVLMLLAKQPAWTPEYEEFARRLVPNLDYQIWDGVSHFVMLDKPNEFNEALLAFLKKHKLLAKSPG